jgi:hypothetical protein
MTTSTTAVASSKAPGFARRKSRTLIGWLPEQEGALWLSGRQMANAPNPAHIALCQAARAAVAARPIGCEQTGIFSSLPSSLDAHIANLQGHPKSAQLLAEFGTPQLVDLRKVCAAQPTIHIEDAVARVGNLTATDLQDIAAVTLPLHQAGEFPASFDPIKNAFLLSSPNPNLRISGQFGGELQPGVIGYGFFVELAQSYLQVAGVGGRYFLRDGYHRAYGLLAAGIHLVPALVRDFASFEQVGMPAGLLSPTTYLGNQPPLLGDYLDQTVSADTSVPLATKMLVVQAIELSPLA